ncbi:hypothetical protein HDU91_006384 [Kappamyces sp. JEL0680]|nr:hypothetical protein HDU91_006384 [Kappamyces sp. JEL0680]
MSHQRPELERLQHAPNLLPRVDTSIAATCKRVLKKQLDIEYYSRPATATTLRSGRPASIDARDRPSKSLSFLFEPAAPEPVQKSPQTTPMTTRLESLRHSTAALAADLQPPKPLARTSKCFMIMNGHIIQDSLAFREFLQEACQAVPANLVVYFLAKLQELALRYCKCSCRLVIERLAATPLSWMALDDAAITETFLNRDEVRAQIESPGQRYQGYKPRAAAATKIQAVWRGYHYKKGYLYYKFQKRCARKLVEYFRMRVRRRKRLQAQEALLVESCRLLDTVNDKLRREWEQRYNRDRTAIVINSFGFGPRVRAHLSDMLERQKRNFGRLAQLLNERNTVVYITPELTADERWRLRRLLGIYFDYEQLTATKRLQVIEIATPLFASSSSALSNNLLLDGVLLHKLKTAIRDMACPFLDPIFASREDARICQVLNIPMLGNVDVATSLAQKRSKQRHVAKEAGSMLPPGSIIWPKSKSVSICETVQDLRIKNPDVKTWVVKMNEYADGNGIAILNLGGDAGADPLAPSMVTISSPVWGSWEEFSQKLVKNGGVIEACAPADKHVEVVSVHLHIAPNQDVAVLGSNSMVGHGR